MVHGPSDHLRGQHPPIAWLVVAHAVHPTVHVAAGSSKGEGWREQGRSNRTTGIIIMTTKKLLLRKLVNSVTTHKTLCGSDHP